MNTAQLQYFDLTYQELSFSAAARRVPMSSQGLAKAIHSLEAELGVPLFEPSANTPGRLRPTPFAREMAEYCRVVTDARSRLDQGIARISQSAEQTIRLAVAIGTLSMLGMDLVSEFRRSNLGVNVVCDDLPDNAADEAVLAGDCSLGLTVLPAPQGAKSIPLVSCDRYVWVRADDPLAGRTSVSLGDLADRSVALVGPQFKQYDLLTSRLDEQGVRVKELVTSSEMIWLHQFAKDGAGIAFTARSVLPLFADDQSVVALPFTGMPYQVGVTWAQDHALTPAEHDLVRLCKERATASGFGISRNKNASKGSAMDEETIDTHGREGSGAKSAHFLRELFHRKR